MLIKCIGIFLQISSIEKEIEMIPIRIRDDS